MKKTALITGGAKGIGASISRIFHENGYHVFLGSRNNNGFAAELGDRAAYYPLDVRDPDEMHSFVQAGLDWTGQLDVFINNAGYSDWRSVSDVEEDFWDQMIDTNLKGAFFGSQAAAAHLQAGGCIINISSLAGKRGSANNSVYCASKFGVNGITQALAKELGPNGIRVNAVCPVYVRTEGLLDALTEDSAPTKGQDVENYLSDFAASNSALETLPTAEEIAHACLFLASPSASAITGQCINVDCGVLPQ